MKEKWIRHYALVELWIGIVAWGVIAEIVILLITKDRLYHSLGLLLGVIGAVLMAAHMERTIDKALSFNEKGARAAFWQGYLLRYMLAAILILAAALSGRMNPITVFVGLLLLKISAYTAPLTHKISEKVCGKEAFEREMVPEEEQYPEEFEKKNEEEQSNLTKGMTCI